METNGYELSRNWFDWSFENPEKISPNHSAIYFFAIEHCNRLGWKEKFGFPTQMVMDAIGIKKHQTYIKYFNDLVDWGFFNLVQKSTNQYSANIISIKCATPKNGKALDKAFIKHRTKQTETNGQSTGQSNSSVDKQLTNKPIKQITIPAEIDFLNYCKEKLNEKYLPLEFSLKSKYMAWVENGWKTGENKEIKNWKSTILNTIPYLKAQQITHTGGMVR